MLPLKPLLTACAFPPLCQSATAAAIQPCIKVGPVLGTDASGFFHESSSAYALTVC